MTDHWATLRERLRQSRPIPDVLADRLLTDADALLIFKGQAEAALEALEHGLTDAPEGILRDALAALPEYLREKHD